jgi:hypothetical protein
MTVAHALYFAVPLVLWLALRAIERDRLFSRLYLAIVLVLMYFPSELIVGVGPLRILRSLREVEDAQ